MNIMTLLEKEEIQIVCTRLEYGRPACREALVTSLDRFLRSHLAADGANDTKPYDVKGKREALDDILTEWLEARENGTYFWPSTEEVYPFTLRYDRHCEL